MPRSVKDRDRTRTDRAIAGVVRRTCRRSRWDHTTRSRARRKRRLGL